MNKLTISGNKNLNLNSFITVLHGTIIENILTGVKSDYHILLNLNTKYVDVYGKDLIGRNFHGITINNNTVSFYKVYQNNFDEFTGNSKF